MKQILVNMITAATLVLASLVSTTAFAQTKKNNSKIVTQPAVSSVPTYTMSTATNEITALGGLTAGAPNLGVDYAHMNNSFGWGGYFFLQTSKDKAGSTIISQIMAMGGLLKINILDNSNVKVYVAPGFGLAMIKDGAISGTGTKSDETVIGPSFKIGAQYKIAPNFALGLEKSQYYNMLDDNLNAYVGPAEYYSVSGSFEF